jgi:hypothetical protein
MKEVDSCDEVCSKGIMSPIAEVRRLQGHSQIPIEGNRGGEVENEVMSEELERQALNQHDPSWSEAGMIEIVERGDLDGVATETRARDREAEEAASEAYLRDGKRCPRCGAPTERSGGCNEIACPICETAWCWLCGKALRSLAGLFSRFGRVAGRYPTRE